MRFPTLADFELKRKMMKQDRPAPRLRQPIASNQLGCTATSGFCFMWHHLCIRSSCLV